MSAFAAMTIPHDLAPWVRYHALGPDELFHPIAFGLVTDRMCAEILAERKRILSFTPASRRLRQRSLMARYDPRQHATFYQSLLRPFREGTGESRIN